METTLCGIRIDPMTAKEAVAHALADTGEPCVVLTPDAGLLERCLRSPELAEAINTGVSLSLPCGSGVERALRHSGIRLACRENAVGFAEELIAESSARGLRVFLLGGGETIAETAAGHLRGLFPSVRICGTCWDGGDLFSPEEEERLRAHLSAVRPDVLIVALPQARAVEWIAQNRLFLQDLRVIAAPGRVLDLWAGKIPRSPALFHATGNDWAWRFLRHPGQIRHLPALFRFALTAK